MTAALLDSDPAAGILAVAQVVEDEAHVEATLRGDDPYWSSDEASQYERRWTPALALLISDRWREVVRWHKPEPAGDGDLMCRRCCVDSVSLDWPCADVTGTADEARAYLGADQPTDPVPAGADPARSDPSISA